MAVPLHVIVVSHEGGWHSRVCVWYPLPVAGHDPSSPAIAAGHTHVDVLVQSNHEAVGAARG
jgi:hypothetical protein